MSLCVSRFSFFLFVIEIANATERGEVWRFVGVC